jgi:sugar phosphate isomerase/epimerase
LIIVKSTMNTLNRRQFLSSAVSLAGSCLLADLARVRAAVPSNRKMTMCLSPGSIGVSVNQVQAIELAQRFGFESVEPFADYLANLNDTQCQELIGGLKEKGLVFGCASLGLEFRQDDTRFEQGMKQLPKQAAGLKRAGVNRCGTWLSPCDQHRTYLQNYRLHARRLREAAQVLNDHGLRLGLEYVGTKTSRDRCLYQFIHTMAEMKELIAEIGTGNVGLVLDSWHWWQAGDTAADILSLSNTDVISVDLNDAPTGIDKDKQLDNRRELPAATDVINDAEFLNCLVKIGYDGPVRAEPFNRALNQMTKDDACAATIAAMKKAFSLIT